MDNFLTIDPGTMVITIINIILLLTIIAGIVIGIVALVKVYRKYMGSEKNKK